MGMTIKRKKDNRVVKCILHRTADIPGGVGVSVANLGGSALLEGTPLGKGKDGLFEVCKTAKVLTQAEANATTYEVAKGHHFKVGDRSTNSGIDRMIQKCLRRKSTLDKEISSMIADKQRIRAFIEKI